MTQEEKELLLKDLSARLAYKPRVRYYYHSIGFSAINGYSDEGYLSYQNLEDFSLYPKYGLEKKRVYNISPYLRPMSSMTEEEREELSDYLCERVMSNKIGITIPPNPTQGKVIPFTWMSDCMDWLNSRHFDYRGLIPMGLALPATEDMYK